MKQRTKIICTKKPGKNASPTMTMALKVNENANVWKACKFGRGVMTSCHGTPEGSIVIAERGEAVMEYFLSLGGPQISLAKLGSETFPFQL